MTKIFKATNQENSYIRRLTEETANRAEAEIVSVQGIELYISPTTFSPCEDSTHLIALMMKHIPQNMQGKRVLEIGTASGALSIHAVKNCKATNVIATEIDNIAFEDAQRNFQTHGVDRHITLLKDPEINANNGQFDYIVLSIVMAEMAEQEDGFSEMVSDSLSVHDTLFKNLKNLLNPGGRICMAYTSYGDIQGLEKLIERYNLQITSFEQDKKFDVNWYYLELAV